MDPPLQIVLLDTIDVPGIQAGKRFFHAKLNVDLELPRGITRDDAFKLPRGTDVYLKLVDQDAGPQLGHIARISVNYVVVNGRHVPLATEEWRDSFYLPGQTTQISRRPQPVHVVWAAGQPKWFSVHRTVRSLGGWHGSLKLGFVKPGSVWLGGLWRGRDDSQITKLRGDETMLMIGERLRTIRESKNLHRATSKNAPA